MNARIFAGKPYRKKLNEDSYGNPEPQQSWTTPAAAGGSRVDAPSTPRLKGLAGLFSKGKNRKLRKDKIIKVAGY